MTEPTSTVVPEQAGLPAAVLWDMDGTLVDTEPYWIATEYAMAEKYGGTWSQEQALSLVGNDLLSSGRVLKEAWDLPQSPAEVVEELLDGVVARVEESVPWQPGAPELLAALREAGVPCALVTMSYERFVAPILRHLPPETYLTAAASLGLEPQDCVAIEDSNTGAKSAEAAGCAVLVVENHVPVLEGPRRVFRPTLVGLGPADVAAVRDEVAARG